MSLTANDKKILRRIREKVISTHWMKGDYYRVQKSGKNAGKEKFCLVGFVNAETLPENLRDVSSVGGSVALRNVAETTAVRRGRILWSLKCALAATGSPCRSLEEFNDAPETKRRNIVDVVDIALGDKNSNERAGQPAFSHSGECR